MLPTIAAPELVTVTGGQDAAEGCAKAPPAATEPERCTELHAFSRAAASIPGMGELAVGREARAEAARMGCAWAQPKQR